MKVVITGGAGFVVSGWPADMQAARAIAIGLPQDDGVDSIVRDYTSDYLT